MNILLAVVIVINLAILGLLFLFFRQIAQVYKEITVFVSPPDDHTPSMLAKIVSSEIEYAARVFTLQLKTTFMGVQSGQVRAESAVKGEILQDELTGKSPGLGALLSTFPGLKRRIVKNPALLDVALELLARKSHQVAGEVFNSNNENDYAARLHRYEG